MNDIAMFAMLYMQFWDGDGLCCSINGISANILFYVVIFNVFEMVFDEHFLYPNYRIKFH